MKELDMNSPQTKPRGPRQRFSAEDATVIRGVLDAATRYLVPNDATQRQLFSSYMPDLYVLRNKGCSFSQIAALLKQCGFNLHPATVRQYYSEMLADRLDECQRRMNEQILLMAEVRKEIAAVDPSLVHNKLAEIDERSRSLVASKTESIFGVREDQKTTAAHEPAKPSREKPGHKLLNSPILQDEPVVPEIGSATSQICETDSSSPVTTELRKNHLATPQLKCSNPGRNLRCVPLASTVKLIKKKEELPDEVYQPGDMEHPAIPGLILNLEQRLSSASLEYIDLDSDERSIETLSEKRFRVFWQKPVPMTPSRTAHSFVKMDMSLFPKR
ncbi:hypothetical protein [Noviherbaspirillum pedocola]|uniref:Uncharacterized protein n=1 Tax=Noviherbaspirillum pedocola TaxID=2801341 RepID=A0A934W894_9BURK|nr:hypothetical protein [Noviherbaspirillum pedocola]MBK4737305.1 hypothetical protein [Noviherbaspirillum pedocola]